MRVVALGYLCNNACIFCAQGELRATGHRALESGARAEPPLESGARAEPPLESGARAEPPLESGARAEPLESGARTEPPLDADSVRRGLEGLSEGEIVAFVGGEPTVHDELPEWIRAADASGAKSIVVQTNARRLAYPSYARTLREASARVRLDVSLHGSSAAMHDYHTQVPGSFGQTISGLRNARAAGLPAAVTTVVTRSNFRHLADVVRLAHAAGVDALHLALAAPFGAAARAVDRVVPDVEMVTPYLRAALAEASRLGLSAWGDGARSFEAPPPEHEVRDRFAGIGDVEPRDASPAPRRLAVLGKPSPARDEVRASVRRTGTELAQILPGLFGAGDAAGDRGAR